MNDSIGKKIAKLRKKAKMTQEDLAQKLFITDGTISKWETNKSVPDYENLKTIAKLFDVKINYFLEDTSIRGHLRRYISMILRFIINNYRKIIFTIIFLFLLLYFLLTYNSYQMYEIKVEDDNFITFDTGYYIKSNSKIVLNITNIETFLNEDNIISKKIKLYTFVNDEKTYFYETSNFDYIMIKQLNGYAEYFNKKLLRAIPKLLYMDIELLYSDNTISNYSCKLAMQKIVDSKWFFHRKKMVGNKKEINIFNNNKIKTIIINKGFTQISETEIYYKDFKKYILYFDLDISKMFYSIKEKDYNIELTYNYKYDNIYYKKEFLINKKDRDKVAEKFLYKSFDNKIECYIGNCDDYQEIYDNTVKIFNSIIE